MKAAIVTGPNQTPVYGDFEEPIAQTGQELITVTASALAPTARVLAAGSHYASSNTYPRVVGIDGVGATQSGQRVYFSRPEAPFGSMAEKVTVLPHYCLPVPDEVDDVTAAAIVNPDLSSFAALRSRAALKAGETILVNGATGTAGKLAVQIAKRMGAKKVIATGRDSAALRELESLGADITINLLLEKEDLQAALREQLSGDGVDVVLDYLFGESAETLLATIAMTRQEGFKPIRYVVVGGASGQEIRLPAMVLLTVPVVLMGSGLGSVPWKDVIDAMTDVLQAVVPGGLQIDTTAVPLADVEKTWNANSGRSRLVFVVK
ncbi:MAG: alcohol dehydrogenase [Candidatus Nephthysia bennettiae]|uniref:Zinc-binding alcohol dehydrogenase family protein n=1 Tax=Candidatus Nephthysia bennettiae TaxID=3127016 RepID=A0A934K351_9BACT|nr:zinc-binding alcohol dehydrogenase family protein [Candidatus Dormibacteraeota bacterium]MBJ7614610.1 zinc-binding alcohol dehydrogenase family protein [Candidatus Dormibacteraeota bacterium]PZR93126.1 MAG: alcohol dehydrogenase [Candidatus Dormibacteraeota bacterium]